MGFPESPIVPNTEFCILYSSYGVQCNVKTGSDQPGIDADLCPIHRAEMETQRQANKLAWEESTGA